MDKVVHIAKVLACTGVGAAGGWFAGLVLCPDWGDLGFGALEWVVGGTIVGGVVGTVVGVTIFT